MSKKSEPDPDDTQNKPDKPDKKGKKEKKGKKGKGDPSSGPSVAAHSRASYQVRRAKGWGGIGGFAIAAYMSHKAGVPTVDIGLRAIAAGMVGYMLAWACAVTVWRHLVLAELRAAHERVNPPDPDLIPARAEPAKATPDPAPALGAGAATGS